MGSSQGQDHDWLITVACALGIFAVAFVLVQLGVAIELILLALFAACLLACGWAVLVAMRARRRAEATLRMLRGEGGTWHD